MKNFFSITIDASKMSLEELESARKEVREMLASLEYQILTRKMAEHKHSSPDT